MTDESRKIIYTMESNKDFLKIEDYKSSSGHNLLLRKTAAKLYKLAKKYAAMEGYGIAAFSAYRAPEDQKNLHNNAGKNEQGNKIALVEDPQHVRGGALDVVLYKKINGKTVLLTPTKNEPNRGTKEDINRLHKYLQLSGFANYTPEAWHNEIRSEEWIQIIQNKGLPNIKNKLYKPTDTPNIK